MKNKQIKKQKISIVISGWPAVGKTTIATELAKEFRLEIYNGGDILKMLAGERGYSISGKDWWDTEDAKKFMTERKSNPCFDKEVDQRLVEIVKKGNVVITSYTLPWLVKDAIKFWLKGSQTNRAKRMAYRDNISFEEAKNIINLRDDDNTKIYHKTYGFNFGEDLTVFDFALNTDLMNLDALIVISKDIVNNITI
ncbi:MAG TPA: cytidylate kinase family protein [Nitrososphaeraceae archaeon]|nr:cytidylate kinase family protein [Nitrososphaeraceae archaeon]